MAKLVLAFVPRVAAFGQQKVMVSPEYVGMALIISKGSRYVKGAPLLLKQQANGVIF